MLLVNVLPDEKRIIMSRFTNKKKEEIGLSPYALVFRGKQKTLKTKLTVMDFNDTDLKEREINSVEEIQKLKTHETISWINIYGLQDVKLMEQLAVLFDVPGNIFSDIMNPSLRPTVRDFDTGIFISLKILRYPEEQTELVAENLSLLILDHVIVSFQEQPTKTFESVRERIRKPGNKIRTAGTGYLAFALMDVVVDSYIYILGQMGEQIETLEEDMIDDFRKERLDEVNQYKKEMNFLRKNVKPAKEMILTLVKLDSEFIQHEHRIHFKELQDNINEASELSDSYREILYDQLTIYHTMMSTRLNDVMRTLTVFSVVFIPLTFIVGVYGTNFDNLPEIHWRYGYFVMWVIMLVVALVMLLFFKKRKWF